MLSAWVVVTMPSKEQYSRGVENTAYIWKIKHTFTLNDGFIKYEASK